MQEIFHDLKGVYSCNIKQGIFNVVWGVYEKVVDNDCVISMAYNFCLFITNNMLCSPSHACLFRSQKHARHFCYGKMPSLWSYRFLPFVVP